MPFVKVSGVPGDMDSDEIADFVANMQSAVCSVETLNLQGQEDEVTVILMSGLVADDQQRSIMVETSGLRDEPERTDAVRQQVAGATGRVADQHFPEAYVASRVAKPFNYGTMPFWDNASEEES